MYIKFPEFGYDDRKSYEDNYYIWKDMSDRELKSCGETPYDTTTGHSVFRKMWGWKSTQKVLSM